MTEPRKIVVGYDGSDFSMQALNWAIDEAELRKLPLTSPTRGGGHTVRSTTKPSSIYAKPPSAFCTTAPTEPERAARPSTGQSIFTKLCCAAARRVVGRRGTRRGRLSETERPSPTRDRLGAAAAEAALIVAGTGRTAHRMGHLGVITRSLVRHAACSVAVVPP